jgi:hypothetical protein
MKREAKRVHREQTSEEANRLERERASIAEELPELIARDQLRKEAREEQPLINKPMKVGRHMSMIRRSSANGLVASMHGPSNGKSFFDPTGRVG